MVCFAITVYQDRELAETGIRVLRELYPESPVVLCDDLYQRLKLPKFSGQWTERWMRACLETKARIFLKLDPDTRALRPVEKWPEAEIFGAVAPAYIYSGVKGVIYGGAIGFSRSAVERIVDSGLLRDEKYTTGEPYTFKRKGETLSLQDPIVSDVAQRLNLKTEVWDKVFMKMSWENLNGVDTSNYAFVHPVKE